MDLIIDRSKWACGGRGGEPELLNDNGNMCCLGFLALACGYLPEDIQYKEVPRLVYGTTGKFPSSVLGAERLSNENSPWVNVATQVNDNETLGNFERECILKDHFKLIGVDLTFIHDYMEVTPNETESED